MHLDSMESGELVGIWKGLYVGHHDDVEMGIKTFALENFGTEDHILFSLY